MRRLKGAKIEAEIVGAWLPGDATYWQRGTYGYNVLYASSQEAKTGELPRYVWHQEGDVAFEARLVNQGNGEYKGYPLNPDERPEGLRA